MIDRSSSFAIAFKGYCFCASQVSAEGRVLQALYDPDGGHVSYVSAVMEAGNRLYLGNLAKDYVSYIRNPQEAAR